MIHTNLSVNVGKFSDRFETADGQKRAFVPLSKHETLWFNTGTLCNIECVNCYIKSSPQNDALVYITADEVSTYLDEAAQLGWNLREIAFTGGEPFMNPQMIEILRRSLKAGYEVLVLTNAMLPMMRKSVQQGLLELNANHPGKLTLRISIDHYAAEHHDKERGKNTYDKTITGMDWLRDNDFQIAIAGRTVWDETEEESRAGYAALFAARNYDIDAWNPAQTVLFPEMDESIEVPEITTKCWDILNKTPDMIMCSSSRMVVKRKGASKPAVLACTLLPYTPEFELGTTLEEAQCDVYLNHPHCAKFCVLGGASCSA